MSWRLFRFHWITFFLVSPTMIHLYRDPDFVLANIPNIEPLHLEESFLLNMMCATEHRHAE